MSFTDLLTKHMADLDASIAAKEMEYMEQRFYVEAISIDTPGTDSAILEAAQERLNDLEAELTRLETERDRYARYLNETRQVA